MRFRVYYADGSTYSDTDGDLFEAPAWGVLFVTTIWDGRWWGRFGEDYYWWDGERFEGGDMGGLVDYLQQPGPRKILFGRTVTDETFLAVRERALHDPDYPQ